MPAYSQARYMSNIDVEVSTLTSSTVYYSLYNSYSQNINVTKCIFQTMSATGSGNTKSAFGIARSKGTVPSGGSIVSYSKNATDSPNLPIDVRKSSTGLTTGLVIEPYFMEMAVRTGSDGHIITYIFDGDAGFVLSPSEGIVILADGAMIAGASLHGCFEYYTRI